ncbi:unnamed protein product [Heterosigma akashiwo]
MIRVLKSFALLSWKRLFPRFLMTTGLVKRRRAFVKKLALCAEEEAVDTSQQQLLLLLLFVILCSRLCKTGRMMAVWR